MIRKLLFGVSVTLLFASCGNDEAITRAEKIKSESLTTPQAITSVSAVGKIEPGQGLIAVTSENGGVVMKVFKQIGDELSKGDIILTLKPNSDHINEAIIRDQIAAQQKRTAADFSAIAQYKAEMDEKRRDLAVSERLEKSGAETLQNVQIKRKELAVIAANLTTAQKNAAATQSDVTVWRTQLQEAKSITAQNTVRAESSGTVVTLDAKPGTGISPLTAFATIAPTGKLVVHGEIDEMFASRVSLGQAVTIMQPGTVKILTQGKITFLSPILEDKSLFYELAGEQSDRRVRRFKAELQNSDQLLINQKVQCIIKID